MNTFERVKRGGTKPICFVLMPFGKKPDANGRTIDFDAVYEEFIKPAIEAAELESVRTDEEIIGGTIHKQMFEMLLLCEFVVADLTTANANVFYELGVRHAVLPATTVLLMGGATRLPFDVALLRVLPYQIDGSGKPLDPASSTKALSTLLTKAREQPTIDSPLFQLLERYPDIIAENMRKQSIRKLLSPFAYCFISYSSKDSEFANQLYDDLSKRNVRCWFAPHSIRAGEKIYEQIKDAIHQVERVLLVLSEHSMDSQWVNTEIASARKRELHEKRQVLFPIRLVSFEAIQAWESFDADIGKDSAKEVREYFIPDFSDWQNKVAYEKSLQRLLDDLNAVRRSR